MAGLGETVLELMRRRTGTNSSAEGGWLRTVDPEGSNPGALRMLSYVPPGLPPGSPLVVVLHGCTQNAVGYDQGTGWSTLAARHGFALLFPEQDRANNANLCLNWFNPDDVSRGHGEVLSIRQMINQMIRMHRLNPARVYINGLSAGGAMTAAMLAAYPEVFAGGAVIAGLPFGTASGMQGAFETMRGTRSHSAREWGNFVRAASPHRGPWPDVQLWHGTADTTVLPGNLDALTLQWSDVLGVTTPAEVRQDGDVRHQLWRKDGRTVLETYRIAGLSHGTPLFTGSKDRDESVGATGPFMLEAGIGSTGQIARSWGLLTQAAQSRPTEARTKPPAPAMASGTAMAGAIVDTIRDALRAAGLKT